MIDNRLYRFGGYDVRRAPKAGPATPWNVTFVPVGRFDSLDLTQSWNLVTNVSSPEYDPDAKPVWDNIPRSRSDNFPEWSKEGYPPVSYGQAYPYLNGKLIAFFDGVNVDPDFGRYEPSRLISYNTESKLWAGEATWDSQFSAAERSEYKSAEIKPWALGQSVMNDKGDVFIVGGGRFHNSGGKEDEDFDWFYPSEGQLTIIDSQKHRRVCLKMNIGYSTVG